MIASPCINVCRMEGDVCAGCFRTLDELRRWSKVDDDEKLSILSTVNQRKIERGYRRPESLKQA